MATSGTKTVKIGRWAMAILLAPASAGVAGAGAGEVRFLPHRAVYEVTLDKTTAGASVTDMRGRMVYELTGSSCEGWTQNMRFVTEMTSQDGGKQINDLVTSSWEQADGSKLRFNQNQSRDNRPVEGSAGDAERKDGKVLVTLSKPSRKTIMLGGDVYFPVQHSMALVAAARAGKSAMSADLYDGSEKGEKVYQTTSIIGRKVMPGTAKMPASLKSGAELDKVASWPVSISYFEQGATKVDAVPSYELGFRFYENGVSTKLHINYGEFAVNGDLTELTFLEPTRCEGENGERSK
jgi:hypothetical protein